MNHDTNTRFNLMLTLYLWRALIRPSYQPTLWRLAAPDTIQAKFGFPLRTASFLLLCAWALFPFVMSPLLINLLYLDLALRAADVIARQYELGQADLLAAAPNGRLALFLESCRAHLHITHQRINRLARSEVVPIILVFVLFCSIPITVWALLTRFEAELFVLFLIFAIALLGLFIGEYVQLATFATLVGILAGSSRNRAAARVWVIAIFLGVQISIYGAWLLTVVVPRITTADVFSSLLFSLPFLLAAREVVLFVLWYVLRRRFDAM